MLRVLAVDDELPALEELAYLLGEDPRVSTVRTASNGAEALRAMEDGAIDALFLDIRMPGLSGVDIARVLARFAIPPQIVFVTAYDEHAVDAFELEAVDYVLKPVRAQRLAEAIRRVSDGAVSRPMEAADDEVIPVELAGVTRFVPRTDIRYVEAQGDYARLYTAAGSHLVRIPLTTLEERWRDVGFVRIHRRHLIALHHIDEVRWEAGHCTVRIGDTDLAVSRRHTRELRDVLVRRAQP
jgi:two-component system, LytTR family, response regulator LytT